MSKVTETLEMKDGKLRKIIEIPVNDGVMCNTCKTFSGTIEWEEVLEDGSVAHYYMCNNCGQSPIAGTLFAVENPTIFEPRLPRIIAFRCRGCYKMERWFGKLQRIEKKCQVPVSKFWRVQTKEDAIRELKERCINLEKLALTPVISPKVPSHSHYPYEKTHPISRKHRNKLIIVRKYIPSWKKE